MATKGCHTQSGRITAINNASLSILFEAQSACSGCSARSKCGMSESSKREIELPIPEGETFEVGERVQIAISSQMGTISVVVAYLLPLIILIALLALLLSLGLEEWQASLLAIGGVVLYYIGIYLNRNKLENKIKFTINK